MAFDDRPIVELTDKELAKFKQLCEKYGIKYKTEREYIESAQLLCLRMYHELKGREIVLARMKAEGKTFEQIVAELDG